MDVNPGVGVGPFTFGMSVDEFVAANPEPTTQVREANETEGTTVFMPKAEILGLFDADNKLEAVEFFGATPVDYDGTNLLGMTPAEAEYWLESQDDDADLDDPDLTSEKLGVAFFIDIDKVGAVLVFKPGYFNDGDDDDTGG